MRVSALRMAHLELDMARTALRRALEQMAVSNAPGSETACERIGYVLDRLEDDILLPGTVRDSMRRVS